MGGSVKVILKKNDILYKQTRWTNPMPGFVQHDKFFERDEAWWDQYINQETEYKSPDDDFSPEGYGLVILDFDAKRIITRQGYSFFDAIHYSAIWLELDGGVIGADPNDPDNYLPTIVKRMWEKGMLTAVYYDKKATSFNIDYNLASKTYEEIWDVFEKNDGRSRNLISFINPRYYEFKINFDKLGWEYHKISESTPWAEMLELVKKYYTLTDSELKNWDKWLEEDEEFDEDSEDE